MQLNWLLLLFNMEEEVLTKTKQSFISPSNAFSIAIKIAWIPVCRRPYLARGQIGGSDVTRFADTQEAKAWRRMLVDLWSAGANIVLLVAPERSAVKIPVIPREYRCTISRRINLFAWNGLVLSEDIARTSPQAHLYCVRHILRIAISRGSLICPELTVRLSLNAWWIKEPFQQETRSFLMRQRPKSSVIEGKDRLVLHTVHYF